LLPAVFALPDAGAYSGLGTRFRLQAIGFVFHAAVRADRAIRPAYFFKKSAGVISV
jgi:hypothetical protein